MRTPGFEPSLNSKGKASNIEAILMTTIMTNHVYTARQVSYFLLPTFQGDAKADP